MEEWGSYHHNSQHLNIKMCV